MRIATLLLALCSATPAFAQAVQIDPNYTAGIIGTGFYVGGLDTGVDTKDRAVQVIRSGIPGNGSLPLSIWRTLPNGGRDSSYTVRLALPQQAPYGGLPTGVLTLTGDGVASVAGAVSLAGDTGRRPFLARHLEDGAPDTELSADGFRLLDIGFPAEVGGIAVAGHRTYVALQRDASTVGRCVLAAVRPNGSLDVTFGDGGLAAFPADAVACAPRDVLPVPGGVLLLARLGPDSTSTGVVAAFTDAGATWTSFGTQGSYDFALDGGSVDPTTLEAWSGRLVVGGTFRKQANEAGLALLALTPSGALDSTFNGGAGVYYGATPGAPFAFRVGLSIASGALVATVSVRQSYYVFALAATVFAATGERVEQGGEGGFFVRIITSDTFRVYAYASSGAGADSMGRVLVGGHRTLSGSGYSGAQVDRYALVFPTATTQALALGAALTVAPNPTAAAARVTLTLDVPGAVTVRVVDALGRTVATLADRALPAGPTTLDLDVSRLAPGVYAVVAETAAGRTITRVTVVR